MSTQPLRIAAVCLALLITAGAAFAGAEPVRQEKPGAFNSGSAALLAEATSTAWVVYVPHIMQQQTISPTPTYTPTPTTSPTPTYTPTPTTSPTLTPEGPDIDGSWRGTGPDFEASIIFRIANRHLSNILVSYETASCGEAAGIFFINLPVIDGNTFDISLTNQSTFTTFTIHGTFHSDTSATGTMQVRGTFCRSFDTTWSAAKQPASTLPSPLDNSAWHFQSDPDDPNIVYATKGTN
jgi:hypothetical protein